MMAGAPVKTIDQRSQNMASIEIIEGPINSHYLKGTRSSISDLKEQQKSPLDLLERAFLNNPGDFLLSHTVTRAVPSAPAGLTSVFGMGTGVTLPTKSPENRCKISNSNIESEISNSGFSGLWSWDFGLCSSYQSCVNLVTESKTKGRRPKASEKKSNSDCPSASFNVQDAKRLLLE